MSKQNDRDWDLELRESCYLGRLFAAELAIEKGARCFSEGFEEALRGDQYDLAGLMCNHCFFGVRSLSITKFQEACIKNCFEKVKMILKFSQDRQILSGVDLITYGLWPACRKGHQAIAELILNSGKEEKLFELDQKGNIKCLNWALLEACSGRYYDLIDWLIEQGADCWYYGLRGACKAGDRKLAERMIKLGNLGPADMNSGLHGACDGDNDELIKWMIEMGATYCASLKHDGWSSKGYTHHLHPVGLNFDSVDLVLAEIAIKFR